MKKTISQIVSERILILDGAMGFAKPKVHAEGRLAS